MSATTEHKKNALTLRRRVQIGTVVVVGVGLVVLYRRRVGLLVEGYTLAYNEGVDEAYESGLKYGLQLAKETALFGKDAAEYASTVFDKK